MSGVPSFGIDLREFRQGWRILLLTMLGVGANANSSMLYAFGSLVLPLQQAFGWSRADMQSGVSFLFLGAIVGSQAVGWLNLRFGMRPVTVVSLLSLAAVFGLMTSMGPSIIGLYVFLALLPIASLGAMQVTWTHLVNLWFVRNRGLALALVLSGTGLAAIFIPSAVTWSVARWGWQAAFVFLALLPVLGVLPLVLAWMKLPAPSPAEITAEQGASGPVVNRPAPVAMVAGQPFASAIRSARFWALNLALSMVVAAVVSMVTNTVPLLRDMGLSAADAGKVFGSFGMALIAGRVVVGYLVDRLWAPGVAAVALTLPALGCLLLGHAAASDVALLSLSVAMVGIGAGAEFDVAAYLVARYFGLRDYGRLFGVHLGLITLASTVAPWLFGMVYRSTGTYQTMLVVCGGLFAAGAAMLLPLGRYPTFQASVAPQP